jgi:hypothetical protein
MGGHARFWALALTVLFVVLIFALFALIGGAQGGPGTSPSPLASADCGPTASGGSPANSPGCSPAHASPSPSPAASLGADCPTGAFLEAAASPVPGTDPYVKGVGDACSWLSVYLGRVSLIEDPQDPTKQINGPPVFHEARAEDLTHFALVAIGSLFGAPLPDAPAQAQISPSGAIRFLTTPGFVWQLSYVHTEGVGQLTHPVSEPIKIIGPNCGLRTLNLALPDPNAPGQRYLVRVRLPVDGIFLEICPDLPLQPVSEPLGEPVISIAVGAGLPSPAPAAAPQLNPIALSLRAAQGRFYRPDLIALNNPTVTSADAFSLIFFGLVGGLTLALGVFAIWLIFLSGDRVARKKAPVKRRRPARR